MSSNKPNKTPRNERISELALTTIPARFDHTSDPECLSKPPPVHNMASGEVGGHAEWHPLRHHLALRRQSCFEGVLCSCPNGTPCSCLRRILQVAMKAGHEDTNKLLHVVLAGLKCPKIPTAFWPVHNGHIQVGVPDPVCQTKCLRCRKVAGIGVVISKLCEIYMHE